MAQVEEWVVQETEGAWIDARLIQSVFQSVLGQNNDPQIVNERWVIEKALHIEALYECVCEWVNVTV